MPSKVKANQDTPCNINPLLNLALSYHRLSGDDAGDGKGCVSAGRSRHIALGEEPERTQMVASFIW